jgi:hypothetical protein
MGTTPKNRERYRKDLCIQLNAALTPNKTKKKPN